MNNNNILGMRERKGWTAAEDAVLRVLREERGQIKWSGIARTMQLQFAMPGKSGKQCRQRYHNHLKPAISRADWRAHEDTLLLQLHRQCGNRWATIAQSIPGRTENCVKNHFYSKLRKVVRRLSRPPAGRPASPPSAPSLALLSRIVAASECRFRPASRVSEQWVDFASDLVQKLYNFQSDDPEASAASEREILEEMNYFELNFKKRSFRKRDLGEGDYHQRRGTNRKKKTTHPPALPLPVGVKEEAATMQDPTRLHHDCLPQIVSVKTSSLLTLDDCGIKKEEAEAGEGAGSPRGLGMRESQMGEELFVKRVGETFMSFCEAEMGEWEQVRMLEESEDYGYHYSLLRL